MEIVEDVVVRKKVFEVDDASEAYSEIKDLLERKLSFDDVTEEKYYNDVETGTIRSRIDTLEVFDDYFQERLEIYLTITDSEVEVEIKGVLAAVYPDGGWRDSIVYYGYRALFHRLIGIKNQEAYEEAVEDKVEQIFSNLRKIF